jgi:plastocyanin
LVADNGEFESGDLEPVAANASGELLAGTSFRFQFENAGTYTYHCGIHPTMTETVVVK